MKTLKLMFCITICFLVGGAAAIPADSLYQVEDKWTTQEGKEFKLEELRGQRVALAFFYSTCRSVCPMIVETMGIANKTVSTPDAPVHFVLVALDPGTDTVPALKAFAEKHRLPSASWHLLHGTQEEVRRLSVILQAKYAPSEDGQFTHSNFIAALDAEGRVVGSVPGIPTNAEKLADLLGKKG